MRQKIAEWIYGWLGWLFCEIAFSCPDCLYCKPIEKSYELGNYFYNKAYKDDDVYREETNETQDE